MVFFCVPISKGIYTLQRCVVLSIVLFVAAQSKTITLKSIPTPDGIYDFERYDLDHQQNKNVSLLNEDGIFPKEQCNMKNNICNKIHWRVVNIDSVASVSIFNALHWEFLIWDILLNASLNWNCFYIEFLFWINLADRFSPQILYILNKVLRVTTKKSLETKETKNAFVISI